MISTWNAFFPLLHFLCLISFFCCCCFFIWRWGGGLEACSISAMCLTCRLHFWVSDSSLCQQCSRSLNCDFPLTRLPKYMLPFGLADVFSSSSSFFLSLCVEGEIWLSLYFSLSTTCTHFRSVTPLRAALQKKKKSVRCSGSVRRTGDLYRTLHKGIPEGRCSPITVFRERIPPLSLNVEQDVEKIICRAFSILST